MCSRPKREHRNLNEVVSPKPIHENNAKAEKHDEVLVSNFSMVAVTAVPVILAGALAIGHPLVSRHRKVRLRIRGRGHSKHRKLVFEVRDGIRRVKMEMFNAPFYQNLKKLNEHNLIQLNEQLRSTNDPKLYKPFIQAAIDMGRDSVIFPILNIPIILSRARTFRSCARQLARLFPVPVVAKVPQKKLIIKKQRRYDAATDKKKETIKRQLAAHGYQIIDGKVTYVLGTEKEKESDTVRMQYHAGAIEISKEGGESKFIPNDENEQNTKNATNSALLESGFE